ncbi:hypothetical protein R1flu_028837 [Riccia fluitans]|uniref:Uncharacterized protein n=1 Tax=Riccia fluitans TaxID=41844 RepID=A0ABD1XMV0_9MARC
MKPTGRSVGSILSSPRVRRVQRTLHNFQVTIICMFVTVLVLRGLVGGGRFGTPGQDLEELRNHLPSMAHRDRASRSMMEYQADGEEVPDPSSVGPETELDQGPVRSRYFDPKLQHHFLGEQIVDWDDQRAAFFKKQKKSNLTANGKPRILLVSGSQPKPCDNPMGDYLILKNLKNKVDYCRLHDIEIFYNMAHLDKEMSGFWAKLPLLRMLLLSHPEVEWIWWMDSDAFFTDMKFELPMEKYENYNMVLHGWYDMVYQSRSWVGLNTGSFLIRNCQWSLDILDAWAPYGPLGKARTEGGKLLTKYLDGRPEFEADDQSALIYLLLSQKEKWAEKTYLESSYFLHGYWVILVESFEKLMEKYHPGLGDERWPFVTHFVGCKPCHGNAGDYTAERCTKQMERAFNFADNQILKTYGYVHHDLESHSVKKVVESASNWRNPSGLINPVDQPRLLRGRHHLITLD